MRVLIAGASGFIGSELTLFLRKNGYEVIRLVRDKSALASDERYWDPSQNVIEVPDLEKIDAVINLAGENIAGRWTEAKKKRIVESRINATRTICQAINSCIHPPKLLINASAIGFYGDQGDKICTESTPRGVGFLANTCEQWEKETQILQQKDTRVILSRFGVVLSPKGGALKAMLPFFKFGLGGIVGSGKQYMSWILLDEVLEIMLFFLINKELKGPINVVAPHPVTNEEFTKILGRLLSRPTFIPLPAFLARLTHGQMADELLLSSTYADPVELQQHGYAFKYPILETALKTTAIPIGA